MIHTPTPGAQKSWISFAATHVTHAVVFAQLLTTGPINGEPPNATPKKSEGVHAFLVQIRRPGTQTTTKGVRIEDMGHKPCVNGNDNGRLFFDHVRIPRTNLLNAFGDVRKDGTYLPKIANVRDRFLKVSDQLISGRMAIASCAIVISQVCLVAAVQYSATRTQAVRGGGGDEVNGKVCLLDHFTQRKVLLGHLAKTCALRVAVNYVKQRYADKVLKGAEPDLATRLVCAFKAYSTLYSVQCSSDCREKCGGMGLLSVNKLGSLNNCAASLVVVEGDSMLLGQKVAGELLKECT